MSDKTKIEWTDATWPVVTGCREVSPGCANCYAARLTATRLKHHPAYSGLAVIQNGHPRFTGEVRCRLEILDWPLHWRRPRRIFVADMGDLFHETVPEQFIRETLGVMAMAWRHTFQVLTKRPVRMRTILSELSVEKCLLAWANSAARKKSKAPGNLAAAHLPERLHWSLQNVWVGVSAENQNFADERIPLLLQTPAAVRFVSCEPLLGPVDLRNYLAIPTVVDRGKQNEPILRNPHPSLDWVIVGGESGPNARPMHPDWARSLRDQCAAAGVPFFFKQWGEWSPNRKYFGKLRYGDVEFFDDGTQIVYRVWKKLAGRLLDGVEHNAFPRMQKEHK